MSDVFYKEKFNYHGAGFPVVLLNFPFKKIGKEEVLDCDIEQLDLAIAKLLLLKPALLSGNELKFLRTLINESMDKFSSYFHHSPATIKNWEDQKNEPTSSSYEIDFAIRNIIATKLKMEHQISTSILVHSSVLTASLYRTEPTAVIQIPFKNIQKDPFFKKLSIYAS